MATAFKMPQEPCPLPSLESDEESFVVLGQSIPDESTEIYSEEPIGLSVIAEAKRLINSELEAIDQTRNKSEDKTSLGENNDTVDQNLSKMVTSTLPTLPQLNKGIESSNTISITSITPDMTSEEIQNKVSQLIEENIHLKDTILQNNMSLKSQYERIIAWQEDVQKVHQAHRDKLLEAKNCIEILKREKETLKWEFEKSKQVAYELNKKNQDLERLLDDKCAAAKEVLLQRSDDNIKGFQLDVANKKIKDLEAVLENLVKENTRLVNESTKQEESEKIITDLRNQVTNLTLDNENLNQLGTKLKAEFNENDQNVKEAQTELKKIVEERDSAIKKIQELTDKLNIKKQREEAFIMTVNSLKAELESKSDLSEDVINLRTQLTETQTALTQMEYTRTQAYAQVSRLTSELSDVRNQLDMLQSQAQGRSKSSSSNQDEVFALQTQLEVYKADFEEERRAREIIKSENDRLQEDLQHIQRRNQQLQEEIEIMRKETDFVVYPSAPPRSRGESSSTRSTVKCPKCNFGFANVSDLENHVNRCLDLDEGLP